MGNNKCGKCEEKGCYLNGETTPESVSICRTCKIQCCLDCMDPEVGLCHKCNECQYSPDGVKCTQQRVPNRSHCRGSPYVQGHTDKCLSCADCHLKRIDRKETEVYTGNNPMNFGFEVMSKDYCAQCVKRICPNPDCISQNFGKEQSSYCARCQSRLGTRRRLPTRRYRDSPVLLRLLEDIKQANLDDQRRQR